MIDQPHLLIPQLRSAGARDAKQTIAAAARVSTVDREGRGQSERNREAGRTADFPEHAAARQLTEDGRGRAKVDRRDMRGGRAAIQRQVISDVMRPQRRASDDFPISTFMALHIAQEVLPDPDLHLDPKLYGHPGPALYGATQDSLAAVPHALSLSA